MGPWLNSTPWVRYERHHLENDIMVPNGVDNLDILDFNSSIAILLIAFQDSALPCSISISFMFSVEGMCENPSLWRTYLLETGLCDLPWIRRSRDFLLLLESSPAIWPKWSHGHNTCSPSFIYMHSFVSYDLVCSVSIKSRWPPMWLCCCVFSFYQRAALRAVPTDQWPIWAQSEEGAVG